MPNFLKQKHAGDQLEKRLNKYQDHEGLSTGHLNFGLWYYQHRKHFFLGSVIFLSVIALVLFGYSFFYFGDYLLRGMTTQELSIRELTTDSGLRGTRLREDSLRTKFGDLILLPNGNYDLVGTVTNANKGYWLEFDYYFVVQGEPLQVRRGFVLPEEQRYVSSLNQELSGVPTTAELVVDNLSWRRLDRHEISDWQEHKSEYLDFIVQDKEFFGYDKSGLTENLKLSRLSFEIINNTPYSYYQAPLEIILYNQGQLVGVTSHIVTNFAAGEKRKVEISFLGDIQTVSKIDVLPNINIFDQDIIAPLELVN